LRACPCRTRDYTLSLSLNGRLLGRDCSPASLGGVVHGQLHRFGGEEIVAQQSKDAIIYVTVSQGKRAKIAPSMQFVCPEV